MDKILIFSIVGIILLIIVIFLFMKNRKKVDNDSNFIEENYEIVKDIKPEINVEAIDFKVLGNKDKYIISFKGDRIEFLVKDGEIVGIKNRDKYIKFKKIERMR
jgi:hypothetical protein